MTGPTLVTGASGFIGKAVASLLRSRGENVVAVDRKVCDLTQQEEVEALLAKVRPAKIYNCAGAVSNEFEAAIAGNVLPVRHICDSLERLGLPSRLLLLGSAGEYGAVSPQENPVKESQPLRPVSFNGLSKVFQTALMDLYVRRGSDIVLARVFNVAGEGADPYLFVGRMEREIERYKRGEITVLETGPLESVRDYLLVDEVARLCAGVMDKGASGEVYNVGSGEPMCMRELFRRMLDEVGVPWESVREGALPAPKADIPAIYADISKLTSLPA